MKNILEERVSLVAALILGGGSGWGMSALLSADEIKATLLPIAIAVSLLVSLFISIRLQGERERPLKRKVVRAFKWVIPSFVLSTVLFIVAYDRYTVGIENEQGTRIDTVIVKGLWYSPAAKDAREAAYQGSSSDPAQRVYPTDNRLLEDFLYDIQQVWPQEARTAAKLLVLALYTLMIGLLVAGVTLALEYLVRQPPGQKAPGGKAVLSR